MYRQKNTVGNLENVGYALEGHEGYYNVFMMEETQPIFAVGAGAVTKLMDTRGTAIGDKIHIKRLSRPKYPYEYIRDMENKEEDQFDKMRREILKFYGLIN